MRRLSIAQARRCEEACSPRCRCRCGGAAHGRAQLRREVSEAEQYPDEPIPEEWFAMLPEDDPHYRPVKGQRRLAL